MKRIIIYPIMLIMLSLAVSAAECSDGMAINIQGGGSFDCHFTECVGLIVDVSITPHQDAASGEYSLIGCNNVDPLQDDYTGSIRYSCPCTDDYTFNLTTALNSNGTYHITFNQTTIEYGPVLGPIINQTTQETDLLTITLSAYDNDTAQSGLSYSTDASFGSMTGNVYTWQTDYSSEGTYNLTFFVTDGTYTNNETITIIVTHKDEPSPPPPPDDGDNTGGGGGGGGGGVVYTPSTIPQTVIPTHLTESTPPAAEAAPATPAPAETGLEGITGGAVGNVAEERGKGLGSILGAVVGTAKNPAVKGIGVLFLIMLLILLGVYLYGRRKGKKEI